jgi:type I restriction enzyme S subunit
VSSHYFLYEVDTNQVDLRYLEYFLKSGRAEQEVQQFVKGSVNYAAIRPYHFPQLRIPLPPLETQKRIVARLDRVAELQRLQADVRTESETLLSALMSKAFRGEL